MQLLEAVGAAKVRGSWPRGHTLVHQGSAIDQIFVVDSGVLRVAALSEDGRELILDFVGAGAIVGDALGGGRSGTSVVVHEAATVFVIPREAVAAAAFEHAMIQAQLARTTSDACQRLENKLHQLVFLPVKRRLELALVELGERFGIHDAAGTLLRVRFSHDELARFIAASRVSVSLALRELEREGKVEAVGRQLRLQPDLGS